MEDRLNPQSPITVQRGLLTDCMTLITSAKHDKYTGGDVAGVIIRLQHALEMAAREPEPAAEDLPG